MVLALNPSSSRATICRVLWRCSRFPAYQCGKRGVFLLKKSNVGSNAAHSASRAASAVPNIRSSTASMAFRMVPLVACVYLAVMLVPFL